MMRRMREQIRARASAITSRDYLIIGGVLVAVLSIHGSIRYFRGRPKPVAAIADAKGRPSPESAAPVFTETTRDLASPHYDAGHGLAKVPRRKVSPIASAGGAGECLRMEYPGDGPTLTRIDSSEWSQVMSLFHSSKGKLTAWLNARKKDRDAKTVGVMESQLRMLKLVKPPHAAEPDLAWRGIGVFAREANGMPVIRLGGGFLYLVKHNPERARFEMTRLVAQAWAPCELKQVDGGEPWGGLTSCLGVSDVEACAPGSLSEAGWAVSTALAAAVVDPGCKIPAFETAVGAECLGSIRAPSRQLSSEGGAR